MGDAPPTISTGKLCWPELGSNCGVCAASCKGESLRLGVCPCPRPQWDHPVWNRGGKGDL